MICLGICSIVGQAGTVFYLLFMFIGSQFFIVYAIIGYIFKKYNALIAKTLIVHCNSIILSFLLTTTPSFEKPT